MSISHEFEMEGKRALARLRFRSVDVAAPSSPRDVNDAGREIRLCPPQSQRFGNAGAGRNRGLQDQQQQRGSRNDFRCEDETLLDRSSACTIASAPRRLRSSPLFSITTTKTAGLSGPAVCTFDLKCESLGPGGSATTREKSESDCSTEG